MAKKKLYIIYSHDNYYKIGVTTNIKARLGDLQVGNPKKLTLIELFDTGKVQAEDIEYEMQNKFPGRKILTQGEWILFYKNEIQIIVEYIKKLIRDNQDNPEKISRHWSIRTLRQNP